jgi:predicted flavoprotein YhiN
MDERVDIAVVGAGAAGLMAAVQAGRARDGLRIVALDGARKLGAKILVSGGGRCNVTHDRVDEAAFAGSSPRAIRKVLLRYDVTRTTAFFAELGVELKREETGKLFPVTDRARTVLDALLGAARSAGVEIRHPWRVESVRRTPEGFVIARAEASAGADTAARDERGGGGARRAPGPPRVASGADSEQPRHDQFLARRVILATGGRSLPRSGSDGRGYAIAESLGHTLTPRILPGLVPLTLPAGHPLRTLSGVSAETVLELRGSTGKRLNRLTGSTLCTHFGLSGPSVMDMSRHYLGAVLDDPGAYLVANWLPGETRETQDRALRELGGRSVGRQLALRLPERLGRVLCEAAGVDPGRTGHVLTREERRALTTSVIEHRLPVTGHRGYNFAEVTAGGVPLAELRLETLESRPAPGLHLCGEILDVDGRIGGYNFQWAWASGFVAGTGAASGA